MTILSALATLYERMEKVGDAPPPGYSMEKIGGEVVLDAGGKVLAIRRLGSPDGKGKWQPRRMAVPIPPRDRRGQKLVAGKFWGPSGYSIGVVAKKGSKKDSNKLGSDERQRQMPISEVSASKHNTFVTAHQNLLKGSDDAGLHALLGFVENWHSEDFTTGKYNLEILDQNLVFRLNGDVKCNGEHRYIHERSAAVSLLTQCAESGDECICLITGKRAPIARLHPSFKGLGEEAQPSGSYLVSFNIGSKNVRGASSSFGKVQGANAPVSEAAAFAYGTALNTLLAKDSGRNLRIGDTTVVFWAETPERQAAIRIEDMLFGALNPPDEGAETGKLRQSLENIAAGRRGDIAAFAPDTRVYILGLAPNAARLSVRFWLPGSLGDFARHVTRFWADLMLDPPAWKGPPAVWSLLCEVAAQRDAKNIPPRLGGEVMQAVLTGASYPRTLLSGVIGRIRADGDINGRRVAIITAHFRRNLDEKEFSMSLDRENPNSAYRLGRLFAVLEGIQQAALPGLNATIKDRYFAAASAMPARIFPLLVKTTTHHLSNLRKGKGVGLAHWFDAEMGQIWAGLAADLPRALNLEDQGRFIAGYYHQRWARKDTTQNDVTDNGSTEE